MVFKPLLFAALLALGYVTGYLMHSAKPPVLSGSALPQAGQVDPSLAVQEVSPPCELRLNGAASVAARLERGKMTDMSSTEARRVEPVRESDQPNNADSSEALRQADQMLASYTDHWLLTGSWSEIDRGELLGMMGRASPAARGKVHALVTEALNSGQIGSDFAPF